MLPSFVSILTLLLHGSSQILAFSSVDSDGIFTSNQDLVDLLSTEAQLLTSLKNYIQLENNRLEKLNEYVSNYEHLHNQATTDVEQYVGNPLNSFILIKKLTSDCKMVKDLISSTKTAENFLNNLTQPSPGSSRLLKWPSDEDLSGAAVALTRLQETYNLDVHDMAIGQLNGVETGSKLSAHDCFELGRQTYNSGDAANTVRWMDQALKIYDSEDKKSVELSEIYEYLGFTYYTQGDLRKALRYTNELLLLVPDHPRAIGNKVYYEDKLKDQRTVDEKRGEDGFVDDSDGEEVVAEEQISSRGEEYELYKQLCRGEKTNLKKDNDKLQCRYCYGYHPYLMIGPYKEEEVNLRPRLVLYHDVLSDEEIRVVKDYATPRFKRATVQNYKTGELETAQYRVSKTAWLKKDEDETIENIYRSTFFGSMKRSNAKSVETLKDGLCDNPVVVGVATPQIPFLLMDCGCCSEKLLKKTNGRIILLNEYPPDSSELTNLEDAQIVVDAMRIKFRCRGQQIIGCRRRIKQQRSEMNHLRSTHRKQLEEISSQLFRFEASLRAKEKQLEKSMILKEQVILRQQRLIKRLLKKSQKDSLATNCSVEDDQLTPQTSLELITPTIKIQTSSSPINRRSKSEPEYETQNDSDSAIMLEECFTEVSLAVPDIRNINCGIVINLETPNDDYQGQYFDSKMSRSVSDASERQRQDGQTDCRQQSNGGSIEKQMAGRKTKEERRISNRQKLLLLKRHSGFLKRPEILETVYSVEEDTEQVAQQQHFHIKQHQLPKPQTPPEATEHKITLKRKEELKLSSSGSGEGALGTGSPRPFLMRTTSVTSNDSPCLSRRSSASTSCVLSGVRYRIDSDFTDADYSTDDDSTRLFYSETEGDHSGGGTCSCSQPCSRRSSYGYTHSMEESQTCNCAQCLAQIRTSASAPTSRRPSYGSHFNVKEVTSPSHNPINNNNSMSTSNIGAKDEGSTSRNVSDVRVNLERNSNPKSSLTEVRLSHKGHKDVRLNQKTRARSLEDLRLCSQDIFPPGQEKLELRSSNRIANVRGYMERRASFDFDYLTEPFVSLLKDS